MALHEIRCEERTSERWLPSIALFNTVEYPYVALAILLMIVVLALPAFGELQNVEIGGSVELYGAWYSKFYEPSGSAIRIPGFYLPGRPIGPTGTASSVRANGTGIAPAYTNERTRLHVRADFTDNVSAFVEMDSVTTWGDDFRSNYITGTDFRNLSPGAFDLYQSYIDITEVGGLPLQLRLGRQELTFGKGWLVGVNPNPDPFTSLSFDAVRATYDFGAGTVDAWWSKLAENSPREQDGDVDFYGVYTTFKPVLGISFDAYWMLIRDARAKNDTNFAWFPERVEDALGVDNYDVTNLHTVGLRAVGKLRGIDWDVEAAYQFGSADAIGALFKPTAYGDDSARWNTWAGRIELGYTFESKFTPRVYLNTAYYDGEDKRSLSFRQWLDPFDRPQASVSFNRLFSDYQQDSILDGSMLTNYWIARLGVQAAATPSIQLGADIAYMGVVAPFERPASFRLGRWLVPIATALSFWDVAGAKDLGWETTVSASYSYTENLRFDFAWSHYFTGPAIRDGAFIDFNGLSYIGGLGKDDVDYLYFLTVVSF